MNIEKNKNQIIDKSEIAHPKFNFDKLKKVGMAALLLLSIREGVIETIDQYQDKKHPNIIATENFTFHEGDNLFMDTVAVTKEIAEEKGIDINKKIGSPYLGAYKDVQPGDDFTVKLIGLRHGGYKTIVEPAGYFKAEDFK